MPTVLTLGNVRVAIHSNDHPPSHVHAIGRDGERARFGLNCPNGPVRLMEQAGFRPAEIARIGVAVAAALEAICAKWREIHG